MNRIYGTASQSTASMALQHKNHCVDVIVLLYSHQNQAQLLGVYLPNEIFPALRPACSETLYLCFLRVLTTQTILVKLYNVASVPLQNKPQRRNKALVKGVGTRQASVHVACLPQHKPLHLFILCYIIYTSESVVLYLLISILLQLTSPNHLSNQLASQLASSLSNSYQVQTYRCVLDYEHNSMLGHL